MKFSEIVEQLGSSVRDSSLSASPEVNPEVSGVAAIEEATAELLAHIQGDKFASYLDTTAAKALILPIDAALQAKATERGIAWMATEEPRLLFARAIALFYQPDSPEAEIDSTAVIHPTAEIGKDVYIGPYVVVRAGTKIGDRVSIHAHTVLYPNVEIGDRTVLHANCTIHERTRIGADCVIHSGAIVGGEGFGFVPTATGWFKMPQSGYVVLEDSVEVGGNSTIDRPSVGETRIGRNTKIDNLVQIGHGCQIGQSCAIAGQVGLAGGVKVGNGVILAGQVGIVDHVEIGDRAIATAKAGVHSNVAAGAVVTGVPAIPHAVFVKAAAIYKRLPEMYKTLRQLQKLLH
ncbi:UDP-3-O-(3-hydroxymyristoyl)glucosamine N-acyltransferase [Oscillatoria sp. FACHB-1406]|uniref:UDP-3-O-(3-hydroxymyristoyl)glucosamine N-acyltransferase n=1 Tax=Oscillatoria sp. FACHB-1406 TaxID=2692846 RepID=UPI0016892909|nr:UDP-3-O-(3-hydroxymyristoyl)glucosamine N-acyltransferase [Oscillatoria sp. FACHB-1406]MBD2576119.1 UDP-3-O-(3-hydroxymyristoyl)glucosamine N-acyltransferase [Oscillatoria sp. FACHB-1406]